VTDYWSLVLYCYSIYFTSRHKPF